MNPRRGAHDAETARSRHRGPHEPESVSEEEIAKLAMRADGWVKANEPATTA